MTASGSWKTHMLFQIFDEDVDKNASSGDTGSMTTVLAGAPSTMKPMVVVPTKKELFEEDAEAPAHGVSKANVVIFLHRTSCVL